MVANRREQLEEFVRQRPDDAFARYGLAMELMRSGESVAALAEFERLQERHPDYAAGFQQAGQLLIALDRHEDARAVLERGLAAAERSHDRHAASEMQGLLDEIGG
ncbi:MAG TPA: tetratricopeptide repeat protein [Terriglobales bacterium]|nr:tetratricopeptide repeat protein [Terriglobales bacterium]